MKPARRILDKVANGDLTTGILLTDQCYPEMVEYCALAGMDYLIVDREHGPFDDQLTARVCSLGRMTDFAVMLRPIDSTYPTIRRSIDLGPCGFLLPTVQSAEELDVVRDAIYMPPRGSRRPGGHGNYWVPDFYAETWKAKVEDDFIVVPQIETEKGLENADEIAAHEIVTAIGIGPYDLSHSIGVNFQPEHPRFIEAVARIRDAGRRAGKTMWRIGHGPTMASEGYHFLCIGEATGMLKEALSQARVDTATSAGADS